MPLSYELKTGDGVTTNFTFSVPYISQSHVAVEVDDVPTSFTWVNPTTIQISPAPANGASIEIRRSTEVTSRIVDYADGSVLTETDLDNDSKQSFYLAQEFDDDSADFMKKNTAGQYDAATLRIENVGEPDTSDDAATKNYVDNKWLSSVFDPIAAPDRDFVFNDAGATYNFRVESDLATHALYIDGSANRVGISSTNLAPTDGVLHIQSASAGAVAADTNADELVIESSGHGGISILTGTTDFGHIRFGDSGNNAIGTVSYLHSTDTMQIYANAQAKLFMGPSECVFNEDNHDVDFRVEGDTSTHLIFADAGNERVGISSASLAPTDGLLHVQSGTAGVVAANTGSDEVVIESAGDGGISILTPATNSGLLMFGDPDDNNVGYIQYSHPFGAMVFYAEANKVFHLQSNGFIVNGDQLTNMDFVVYGDINTNLFLADTSAETVHIGNSLTTGAGSGDAVIANSKWWRWINNAGTSSANFGIYGDTSDNLNFEVPGTADSHNFRWAGTVRAWLQQQNSGMGLYFSGESSADHNAPSANDAVVYTKDNGSGKTQLCVRFNTGAVQVLATQP